MVEIELIAQLRRIADSLEGITKLMQPRDPEEILTRLQNTPSGNILDAVLTAEQKARGLSLHVTDDHILELRCRGKPIAHFFQTVTTITMVGSAANPLC